MASLSRLIRLHTEPRLTSPYLVAAWPGIGNIGLTAVSYLRHKLGAEEFGEIEPQHFSSPNSVYIENGVLQRMDFPSSKFYYKKGDRDLIIFLGEMQPTGEEEVYGLANLVLDVGQHFGVRRVYTAGAAVAAIHHTAKSRVWGVPNQRELIDEMSKYDIVLMSEIEGREGQGSITGLNGMLLGVANKRNLEGICLLGEIPVYMSNFPMRYPKAAVSVLRVLTKSLGVEIDMGEMEFSAEYTEKEIERVYTALPPEVREQVDRFQIAAANEAAKESITEEDKTRIMEDIEELFGGGEDKRT